MCIIYQYYQVMSECPIIHWSHSISGISGVHWGAASPKYWWSQNHRPRSIGTLKDLESIDPNSSWTFWTSTYFNHHFWPRLGVFLVTFWPENSAPSLTPHQVSPALWEHCPLRWSSWNTHPWAQGYSSVQLQSNRINSAWDLKSSN